MTDIGIKSESFASEDYEPADIMRESFASNKSGEHDSAEIMLYGMPLHDKINEIDDRLNAIEERLSFIRGGKTKKHKRKVRRTRKNRGKGKEWKTTPITDKTELKRLEEYEKRAAEREKRDNEIRRVNSELENQRKNILSGFTGTPMDPKDIERQRREDEKHNRRVNSKKAKERKLTIYDLGGSKRKSW
jgi:hypothetical protein